ncbi:MAG: YihY family inner membrane protein [Thiohalomonadales bacterium]
MTIKDRSKSLLHFVLQVGRHYLRDRCFEASGNLAFTTVLSIIPITIIVVSILSKFNGISQATDKFQNFLFENLVPSVAEDVINYFPQLISSTDKITAWSLIFLLVTAVLLLRSIDDAINTIWQLDEKANKSIRLHYYILVIVIAPVLLGLSFSLTSIVNFSVYIKTIPVMHDAERYLLGVVPLLLSTVAFTLLYKFSPRKYVSIKNAGIGGFIAALLFYMAKYLFTIYISSFPNYQIIYGALSFFPIFLIWIYISWSIILLGAEISHSLWEGENKKIKTMEEAKGKKLVEL